MPDSDRADRIHTAPCVLQVLPALDVGGVERGTLEMARAITEAGGRALVASAGGRMVSGLERRGGEHVLIPDMPAKQPFRILRNARTLERLIRLEDVRLVHARSRAPAWAAYRAARRTGIPFVTTYHGVYSESFPLKRHYNAVMAKGDRVIAISRHVAALVAQRHGVGPDRLRIIPRGVDPMLFDPATITGLRIQRLAQQWKLPEGDVFSLVLMPARFSRWKGQHVLLDALGRLQRPDVICVFIGGDKGQQDYARSLMERAKENGIAGQIRLGGICDDMPAALSLADCVVHASLEAEPFGRTVIEAQAMGRLVIASDLGGPRETVEHGVSGLLVPPGDVEALAVALAETLSLPPDVRADAGWRARQKVLERYTTDAMQRATLDVYNELLG
ncbi:Glycosyltransferase [Granulibacter bethesdensis]|uniref:glycosyltransferase family 4 protein n=1 Tax=Granulibacter bethesdensis TaxID=364410 RepID=UPI0009097F80|nr:glycosyltransferase family 4 protein [Granulibacter bethesdensis]APH56457.1 Glycosyltransferase [Granulibacter bethesdensis]